MILFIPPPNGGRPQGGQTFSQKNIKNPFQKIPESLGGIQIIYPEIQIPIV